MKKYIPLIYFITLSAVFTSCKTVKFDRMGTEAESGIQGNEKARNLKAEEAENVDELIKLAIEEEVKEVDIPKTVIYVDRPVYYPVEEPAKKVTGKDAARKSTESSMVVPEKFVHGTMYYDFDDDFTYEIYCQPYRVTDIQLEPGEQVIEMPFLSEEKVWEIGAGVSRSGSYDVQHFFIKPAYSGLETSFIIITDKRIYHLMLKSFRDCYMTQVKWQYPNTMPFKITGDYAESITGAGKVNRLTNEQLKVDPRFLSFDYKMTYSIFKKPYWLPYRIYDDGEKTYITMNETVLHMTSPILMNKRNERINYWVDKNLIVINELIEKVTLRIGSQKVTIRKKNYKPTREDKEIDEKKLKKDAADADAFYGIHQPIVKQKAVENAEPSSDGKIDAQIQDYYSQGAN